MLDRKLRIVGENTESSGDWLEMAQKAFQSTYGYEWQGDNLLLARESLFFTFLDYYKEKFGKLPLQRSMLYIAYIISWNIWQMDGLKGVVPDSCKNGPQMINTIFGPQEETVICPGCKDGIPAKFVKKEDPAKAKTFAEHYMYIKEWYRSK